MHFGKNCIADKQPLCSSLVFGWNLQNSRILSVTHSRKSGDYPWANILFPSFILVLSNKTKQCILWDFWTPPEKHSVCSGGYTNHSRKRAKKLHFSNISFQDREGEAKLLPRQKFSPQPTLVWPLLVHSYTTCRLKRDRERYGELGNHIFLQINSPWGLIHLVWKVLFVFQTHK